MTTDTAPSSVTGMRLAHRMMTTDLVRLTDVVARIAAGERCPDSRAAALRHWLVRLADEIEHHHQVEDDAAWPVIARHAGPHVDLTELSDDHAALDPQLAAIRAGAATVAEARGRDRTRAAGFLAAALATLRDHLAEHIAAEEAALFPVIEAHVPPQDWAEVEKAASRGGPPLTFMLPRALAVMRDDERRELLASMPAAQRGMMTLLGRALVPGHRRRERSVFGPSTAA